MALFLKKYKLYLLGALLGGLAGYLYWYYVGCESGTCAITSKPLNSTLYGTLMGALALGMFEKDAKKTA
ncbi:MAG: hypothetical protein SFU27_01375 [Thermonemataceae bacterium]|nr:hypothetical protein [Thermonemataceae bacterium]